MRRLVISVALAGIAVLVSPEKVIAQGSISGRVVNSVTGAPVKRAEVSIVADGRTDLRGTAPTDPDGRFVCRSLPAGRYRLGVQKLGYAPMDYGATRPFMAGQVVVLAASEQKTGLVIQLPQLGVLTGTIRDVDGEPSPRVGVQALRREFQRGKPVWLQVGWANADSNGRYRIFHMLPGKYLVAAKKFDQPVLQSEQSGNAVRPASALTYFPGTLDRQRAQPVVLGPGAALDNIDVSLLQSRPITLGVQTDLPVPPSESAVPDGDARNESPGPNSQGAYVQFSLKEKNGDVSNGMQFGGGSAGGSRLQFNELQPGRYILSGEVTLNGQVYAGREEVDLSGGSADVTLHFAPAVDIAGHVRMAGGQAVAAGARVYLVSGDGVGRQGAEAHVQPDGSYVLKNVPPGVWDIGVDPIPKGGYLKSMMLGNVDVLRADMNVTAETKAPLEIVVGAAGAQLSGTVTGGQSRTVLAAPEGDLEGILSFFGVASVDEKGRFEINGLTPGQYRVYAFEDLAQNAWFDPDFLKPYAERGVPVELKPGAKAEITVQAIGAEVAR